MHADNNARMEKKSRAKMGDEYNSDVLVNANHVDEIFAQRSRECLVERREERQPSRNMTTRGD